MYNNKDITYKLPNKSEVELKIYDQEEYSDQKHQSEVYLSCDYLTGSDITALYALNEKLEKIGYKICITHYSEDNFESNIISITENWEISMKKIKRNAGRKKDYDMDERYKPCTVGELDEMMKNMKNADIIKELGLPHATFYRIVKNLKRIGISDFIKKDSIYYYTTPHMY